MFAFIYGYIPILKDLINICVVLWIIKISFLTHVECKSRILIKCLYVIFFNAKTSELEQTYEKKQYSLFTASSFKPLTKFCGLSIDVLKVP